MKKSILCALLVLCMALGCVTALAFSDDFEPIYPHVTAVTRSVDEIYERTLSGEKLPEDVEKNRKEVIKMFRDAGLDLSLDNENWLDSKRFIQDKPSRFSRETPKPLEGDFDQYYSIDAAWNNKIPENHPRTELYAGFKRTFQIATVKEKGDMGGNGIGIPVIIGRASDPVFNMVEAYTSWDISRGWTVRAPENVDDLINQYKSGDQHGYFIDTVNQTVIGAWKVKTPNDPMRYGSNLDDGYKLGFDMRNSSSSTKYSMTGIASEGRVSTNAAKVPLDGISIKKKEIADPDVFIEHALGGAGWPLMKGRTYPASGMDGYINNDSVAKQVNQGVFPYGGVMQLDPDIDLKAMYDEGKLSLPAYKILKAWQEYGYYNTDASGMNANSKSVLLYTSTVSGNWLGDERYDVPYLNGKQGFEEVQAEIQAFLQGDEFFGGKEPKLYITLPVVKIANLDVNADGVIDNADTELIKSQLGNEVTDENVIYDVNQDKVIDNKDITVMTNYFADLPQHPYDLVTVNLEEMEGGYVAFGWSSGIDYFENQSPKGTWNSITAVARPGYEFECWTGEFEGRTDKIIEFIAEKDITVGAKFKKSEDCTLTVKTIGEGNVTYQKHGIGVNTDRPEKLGKGSIAVLKAVPTEGYKFIGWEGDACSTEATLKLFIDSDKEVVAIFEKDEYYTQNFPGDSLPEGWKLTSSPEESDKFMYVAWNEVWFNDWSVKDYPNSATIIDDVDVFKAPYTYRIDMKTNSFSDDDRMYVYFDYQDDKNYYAIDMMPYGTTKLVKVLNGEESVVAEYASENGRYPFDVNTIMTFDVIEDENGNLDIGVIQSGNRTVMFENIKSDFVGGKIGFGEKSAKQLCFKNVVVLNKQYDLSKAEIIPPAKDIVTLENRMENAVAMYIRGTRAYANGSEQVRIDAKNSAVVPYTENGRTLIPVRFVAERFGADVTWDGVNEIVTITLGDKTVSLKIGDSKYTIDGSEYELDVPAKVENGRTLIPLRAVAEALNKKVFWDDRGLIIVSDNEFDKTNDKLFIEELVFLLRTN